MLYNFKKNTLALIVIGVFYAPVAWCLNKAFLVRTNDLGPNSTFIDHFSTEQKLFAKSDHNFISDSRDFKEYAAEEQLIGKYSLPTLCKGVNIKGSCTKLTQSSLLVGFYKIDQILLLALEERLPMEYWHLVSINKKNNYWRGLTINHYMNWRHDRSIIYRWQLCNYKKYPLLIKWADNLPAGWWQTKIMNPILRPNDCEYLVLAYLVFD